MRASTVFATGGRMAALVVISVALAECRPSDVLSVPPPVGVIASGSLANQTGAEGAYAVAKGNFLNTLEGSYGSLLQWSGLLTDEFSFSAFYYDGGQANVDARETALEGSYQESGSYTWQQMMQVRSNLLLAINGLGKYEPPTGRATVGEAYAILGYTEVFIAETYCSGTPLSQLLPAGGFQFGNPVSDDSLLAIAIAHFDSAIAEAGDSARVTNLASVGLARALLDRGQDSAAAAAATNVPPAYVYNGEMEAGSYASGAPYMFNLYDYNYNISVAIFNVSDQEGQNGLDYRSAQDPRLTFDSTKRTEDGAYGGAVPGLWYAPMKFVTNLSNIPLATGIEAVLIEAEAALHRNDVGTWLNDLNSLRNSGCAAGPPTNCTLGAGQVAGQTAGLPSLADPGSDSGRVSLMFRERAFWLFGTGSRLGDLRRLIRQYGRDQSVVYPTGPYPNGTNPHLPAPIPNYGTDVDFTLPTAAEIKSGAVNEVNPNYKGCLASTETA